MEKMPTDVRVPFRKSALRGAIGRAGRWTLVAIVLVLPLCKARHRNPLNRLAGHTAFAVGADSVWIVANDPHHPGWRNFVCAKMQCALPAQGLSFRVSTRGIAWATP